MQACDYENFDITIRGESAPYGVTARYREQTADGIFTQALDQPAWQTRLEAMRRTLYTPNPQPLLEAGHTLFHDLFRDDIRDLWVSARTGLEENRINGLRLRLALQPPAVAALPWETLCDRPRNTVFGVSSRILLVRVEQEYRRLAAPAPLAVQLPLRVLVAAPTDPDGIINAAHEIEIVKRMLNTLGRNQIEIRTMTGRFSIVDLRRRLTKLRPQVLHVLTHGTAKGIQLWQNGRPRLTTAAAFRTTLERTPWVRFAFLNACLAGQSGVDQPLSALGPQLLQAGVPAVLAMQFEIRDDVAADFAHFLYEALLTDPCAGAIDAAVTNARAGLYALNDDQVGYVTPVLWLNAANGEIFKFAPDPTAPEALADDIGDEDAETDNPDRDDSGSDDSGRDGEQNGNDQNGATPPPEAVDAIDIESETRWLQELADSVAKLQVGPELEFALTALQATLQTLRDLLDRLRNWDHTSRVQAYVDQTLAYRRHKAEALRLRRKLREAM
ncbi:MAG: CHAT domain-containing protein [Litorilinea sp.]